MELVLQIAGGIILAQFTTATIVALFKVIRDNVQWKGNGDEPNRM